MTQVRANGSELEVNVPSSQVEVKALDIAIKAAAQINLRLYKSENSSNVELSTSLGNGSQCLDMLKTSDVEAKGFCFLSASTSTSDPEESFSFPSASASASRVIYIKLNFFL